MQIKNLLEEVTYYIIDTSILFLFSLADIDKLKVYFNNMLNCIIYKNSIIVPII